MHTAIGLFEVWRHHCFNFWMAFVVPTCTPFTRLVVVGWGMIPAAVATALPPCSLIETLTPVLVSPVLVIPSACMTRWLPGVAPSRSARALGACIGLCLFLCDGFALLAQPFLREVPSIDSDAVAHVSDNVHQERLGEDDAGSVAKV